MEGLPKNSGFNTPRDYFDKLSERICTNVAMDNAVSKNDGFKVPDNYFNTVHANVISKLNIEEPNKVIKLKTNKNRYYWISGAVAAALILFVSIILNTNPSSITFQDLANSEIENYFNNTNLDFSDYDLAQMVSYDEIEISDMISTGFNEEQIINYLESTNSMDIEELYMEDYE